MKVYDEKGKDGIQYDVEMHYLRRGEYEGVVRRRDTGEQVMVIPVEGANDYDHAEELIWDQYRDWKGWNR